MRRITFISALAVLITLPLALQGQTETRWFLASRMSDEEPGVPVTYDSYAVPISDAAAIEHARALYQWRMGRHVIDPMQETPPTGGEIFTAMIAAGENGINRDYLAVGAPQWSWHITQFGGFAGMIAELYDGNPTQVENDVQGWIDGKDATIGFWSYTIMGELLFQPHATYGDTWIYSPFGWVDVEFWPWVYSEHLQSWLYTWGNNLEVNRSPFDFTVWSSAEQDYIWLREDWFPWAYSFASDSWVFYQAPTANGTTE